MKVELYIDLSKEKFSIALDAKAYEGAGQEQLLKLLDQENLLTKVTIARYDANPTLFMQIIKLISLSTSIQVVDVSNNALKEHGIAVAQELSKSKSINSIYMSNNALKEHGIAVAHELAKSTSIHTVIMDNNWLKKYAPTVVQELVKSETIHSIDIRDNMLGESDKRLIKEQVDEKQTFFNAHQYYDQLHQINASEPSTELLAETVTHTDFSIEVMM